MRATRTDTGELGESLKLLETLPGNLAETEAQYPFFVRKQIVILGEWIPVEQAVSSSPIHETYTNTAERKQCTGSPLYMSHCSMGRNADCVLRSHLQSIRPI